MISAFSAPQPRVFLFLQGPSSSLFAKTGRELSKLGHKCFRVNLNAGDWVFWHGNGAMNFRGRLAAWHSYLVSIFEGHGVTDLVLLGEERPYHKVAVELAKEKGISITVIEMGYLRPDWITVERNGMSSNSHFPNDPDAIRLAAKDVQVPDFRQIYSQSFFVEAALDLAYNLPNVFLSFLFPHYRRHGLFHPLKEYAGWVKRLLTRRPEKQRTTKLIQLLKDGGSAYFLYPLQLETDYQLRAHSPYSSQFEAIEEVLASFSSHAPPDTHLVVKSHPLDNGLLDWGARITEIAVSRSVSGRVHYIDDGDLSAFVEGCCGMVSVNSTAILHGLKSGTAAKVLGCAVYDLEGMTHQGPLDGFWSAPKRPDRELTEEFYRLLAQSIHVRGNFYSRRGTDAAALAIASRLSSGSINQPGGDCGYAPRKRPQKFQTGLNVSN
ncbi:capsule biosynthesis protein [Agrobacterium larrymoorei]|uniref:Capsular biosynthesis protein n=1 Tax=Agrobacterium larrymoorei TaxID=160699 RepID=A0AAF0HDM1_9HYPH|nr:capsular biosynthesis protein [Agrobacterium larrymoorei]WHA42585.1 capsular biosynthesis protein [Agrobacterium larrymoorei]